jgi:anion transporter
VFNKIKEFQNRILEVKHMSPSTITLLFLLFAVVMFVLEKIPLGVTSMIVCVGLVVTGILDIKTAFSGFIDSNVILFVAMFIVGGALFETGMANKVGGIVTKFARTERMLIIAIMAIVGLMSGVLSNTGTAAVLIPVVIGIAAKSGYKRSRLLMPLVFAAAMGGNLSLIGAPGNLIAQSALDEIGLGFGFFEYAVVGIPILIAGIIFYATVGYKLLPNHDVKDDGAFDTQKDFSSVPAWKQWLSLIILVLTLFAMIFEEQIGIKLSISGCIGALLLILTGVISEKDALQSIDLKTIFLFGGTLSLASALSQTGAGEMIANTVIGTLGKNPSPYILTFVVFVLCCTLTNFMSNTATTALMVPICLSIAQGMGADPRAVLMACVIGGSCAYATPIGMPANTMVVGAGGYKFMDYVKSGFPLIIIATVVSMVILPIAFPFFP